jgi:hypothetical protein
MITNRPAFFKGYGTESQTPIPTHPENVCIGKLDFLFISASLNYSYLTSKEIVTALQLFLIGYIHYNLNLILIVSN